MDLYKLLSRSTKLNKKQAASRSEHRLPSGGQNANPQLFGRDAGDGGENNVADVATTNGSSALGKRKRGVFAEAVPFELDFFGNGASAGEKRKDEKRKPANSTHVNREAPVRDGTEDISLSEEEKRALLKAHKIKVTVLEEPNLHPKVSTAKRKTAKLTSVTASTKQQKRQIFPAPLASFTQLRPRYSISRRLAENIEAQGYKLPTEVQFVALPLLMDNEVLTADGRGESVAGCDLLTVAPTGSGKTLAFLIPAINAILRDKRVQRDQYTQAVILAPTRELAHQIVNEGKKLVQNTGVRITLMRKGMRLAGSEVMVGPDDASSSGDESNPENNHGDSTHARSFVKAHIVVSTPQVIVNALSLRPGKSTPLSELQHLILDEADILLDPLFREQVEAIWDACTNPSLRVSLWSATMASSIEDFAMLQFSKLGHAERKAIVRLVVGLKDTALPTLTHTMTYTGTEAGKLLALRQLLHPTTPDTDTEGRKALRPPFLVFTQTIERAKALQAELRYDIPPEAGGSARMAALHSEMSERAREQVMTAFRKGEIWVIITTDLLARGIDFRGLNGVVNYDVPTSAAVYVHRVGRTGRAGREGGVAVTFYTKEDIPFVKPIANVIAASEKLRAEGKGDNGQKHMQQWMLDALPTTSKREKKEMKKRGVEARRTGLKSAMITTKSGYERKQDSRRRDMKGAKNQRPLLRPQAVGDDFAGFSD
jgi:ATP-dependent RNA helicase DDX52/ROK1